MKKKITVILAALILSLPACQKAGYKEITEFKYDYIGAFNEEGLAYVRIGDDKMRMGGKCGFIDKKGNEVVPVKYDDACYFIEGFAIGKVRGFKFGQVWVC